MGLRVSSGVLDKIDNKEPITIIESRLTAKNLKNKCPILFKDFVNDGRIFSLLKTVGVRLND